VGGYWCRSALNGFVLAARHAGTNVAATTTPSTIARARVKDTMSIALTPNPL